MISLPCRCPKPELAVKPSGQTWCRKCGGAIVQKLARPTRP